MRRRVEMRSKKPNTGGRLARTSRSGGGPEGTPRRAGPASESGRGARGGAVAGCMRLGSGVEVPDIRAPISSIRTPALAGWSGAVRAPEARAGLRRDAGCRSARPTTYQDLDARLLDRALQAVAQRDLGGPAEQFLGQGDVRAALLGVVDRQRLEDDLRAGTGQLPDRLREFQQSELVRISDVHRIMITGLGQGDDAPDEIADVTEGARLATVAEDRDRAGGQSLAQEGRDRAAVVGAHAASVRVEDPHYRRVDALLAVVGHRQGLRVALGLVVDTPRADRVDVAPVGLRLGVFEGVAVDLGGRRGQEAR